MKDDGVTRPRYGGNKIRKLDRLLPEILRRGASRVVTLGAAGSHVLATTLLSREVGLDTAAVLVRAPWSDHPASILAASLDAGLQAVPALSTAAVPIRIADLWRPGDAWILIGGSSVTGSIGYLTAVSEIAAQIRADRCHHLDVLVAVLGSGGTAGLLAGVVIEDLKTRVVASVASGPRIGSAMVLRLGLARRTANRKARHPAPAAGRAPGGRQGARGGLWPPHGSRIGRPPGWQPQRGSGSTRPTPPRRSPRP
ncbi:MAG: pyridoxal-phosphate dependent enzyme [Comamonadaceae bacterium]|nr:pyridoxal-phosphate dependent enzyme [Comamonadaceae bacterium]